ncbi:MAG TPA: hypothetical protein DCR55_02345 [Lentisphaeria bacterium]|jgi:hypothetical protein|nr:hypothetical protein [Lentisphaeria bacterium]
MNSKFLILSLISLLLKILGWLIICLGAYVAIAHGLLAQEPQVTLVGESSVLSIGAGSFLILTGLLSAAFGEIIGVLFSIELNTRTVHTNPS